MPARKNGYHLTTHAYLEALKDGISAENIEDAINYRTVTKAIIAHIEQSQPFLVERLVAELAKICFETDRRIQAVEITVEKPGALRFARSVGITIYRTREEVMNHE